MGVKLWTNWKVNLCTPDPRPEPDAKYFTSSIITSSVSGLRSDFENSFDIVFDPQLRAVGMLTCMHASTIEVVVNARYSSR